MNYKVYHETFSGCINEIFQTAEENKVILEDVNFIWGCIGYNETARYSLAIEFLKSKSTKKALQVQVARLESGRYELNMYIL